VFHPVFNEETSLADQYSRLCWYIPRMSGAKIYLPVHPSLRGVKLEELETPPYLRKPGHDRPDVILCDEQVAGSFHSQARVICVWSANTRWMNTLWRFLYKIRVVDPQYYLFSESHSYPAILWYDLMTGEQRSVWIKESNQVYQKMFAEHMDSDVSFVFGTGPSSQEISKMAFNGGVKIICNSMVRNRELLDRIKPSILVFIDSVFHFGASDYAARFLQDACAVILSHQVYAVTNQVGYALIRAHHPELKDFLIALPAKRFGKPVILTIDRNRTRDYTNVLTRCMLPIATGLSNKIVLLGFDGRKQEEGYFWKHNPNTQYTDSMESTKLAHPAFFRDIHYDRYYEKHCQVLENFVRLIEENGKSITTWTESYIPPLAERLETPRYLSDEVAGSP
jgi:hypothetical protein